MPSALQVTVDPSRLNPGAYQGTITINAPNATPPSTKITVNFNVQSISPPKLNVTSQRLNFTAVQNSAAQSAQVQVQNAGGGSLPFSVAIMGAPWLSVTPSSGTATPTSPVALTVTATPGSLAPGTYQGTLVISTVSAVDSVSAVLPVTLSVSAPNGRILLSQSGLNFTAVAQGGAALAQSFWILNIGQGSMNWSAKASTLAGGANWLKVSPASGTVVQPFLDSSQVSVTVDQSGLAAGDYYGRIQINAGAANSPQIITVALTVLPAGSTPGPEVRPSALVFTGIAGVNPGSQDVTLGNLKAQPDSYVSSVISRSFTYLPASAGVAPNQPATLRVLPDFTKLSAGAVDRGTITLQFSDGTARTISVLSVAAPATTTAADRLGLQAAGCTLPKLEIQFRNPASQQTFAATLGKPMNIEAQVVDDCGNLIGPGNASVNATFSNRDPDIHLTHIGNGIWTGTWRPVNSSSGTTTISVVGFNSTGSVLQSGQSTVAGTLSAGTTPTVTAGGVVHAASDAAGMPIAPGSLISIYGSNLADAQGQSSTLPLPTQQSGAQVLLGDTLLPILYTSNGQLNAQVPFNVPINGEFQISVQRDNLLSIPEQLVIAAAQPGIFTVNQQGSGQGVVFKSDGVTLAQTGTPAVSGETVVIYCTGLGAVDPALPEGAAPPVLPLSNTVNPVTVTIGGRNAPAAFSGLTPGFPGLYQVNAVVPDGVSGDAVPVVVSVAGQVSPVVTLAVR
jgi:uncharacterized protein (TIGR03437 family)